MNAKQFFDKVSLMREAQKEYFRTRSGSALTRSRNLESEVDAEISRVKAIMDAQQPKQGYLFDNQDK